MTPLAREIIVILAIKTAALAVLWLTFFRAPAAPHMTMDSEEVAQHVLVAAPKAPHAEP